MVLLNENWVEATPENNWQSETVAIVNALEDKLGLLPPSVGDVFNSLVLLAKSGGAIDSTVEITTPAVPLLTLPHNYLSGSLKVYKVGAGNEVGLRLLSSAFSETSANTITITTTPDDGDTFIIDYKY